MAFENSSFYILPLVIESQEDLHKFLTSSDKWREGVRDGGEYGGKYGYLFNYVSRIIESEEMCRVYQYADPSSLPIYMFHNEIQSAEIPVITEATLYAFGTGIGFFELKVSYGGMTMSEICNFAYHFKVATRAKKDKYVKGDKKSLHVVLDDLFPGGRAGARRFITGRDADKYQGLCFHMIKTDYKDEAERNLLLFRLKRSYTDKFLYDENNDFGQYDMTFAPYEYLAFGGCQEGFAALCRDTGIESTDFFINEYFYPQLIFHHHYMYLILLNQRFSELLYVEEIATTENTKAVVEGISKKIVTLKTRYSFHVVSDDYIYQNIYARMYKILDIDKLFLDIEENGDRLTLLQNNELAETEKANGVFLMCLSFLTVFSALVDLATYLDRMSVGNLVSTVLSATGVLGIFVYAAVRFVKQRKKRKGK
ncbi:MAG: hypothetical protein IKV00_03020 [Clostridia bacterium]|nr:hypothetical protein [Clostridia bacterium]